MSHVNLYTKTDIVRQVEGLAKLMDVAPTAICLSWEAAVVMHGLMASTETIHLDVPHYSVLKKVLHAFPYLKTVESNIFGDRYIFGAAIELKLQGWTDEDTVIIDGVRVMNLDNLSSNFEYFHQHEDCGEIRRMIVKKILDNIQGKIQDNARMLEVSDVPAFIDGMSHMVTTLQNTARPLMQYKMTQPNCPKGMKFWDAHDNEWHVMMGDHGRMTFSRAVGKKRGDYATGGEMEHYLDPLIQRHTKYDLQFVVTMEF